MRKGKIVRDMKRRSKNYKSREKKISGGREWLILPTATNRSAKVFMERKEKKAFDLATWGWSVRVVFQFCQSPLSRVLGLESRLQSVEE